MCYHVLRLIAIDVSTDLTIGHIHRPCGCVYREGRKDHLPDCQGPVPPVNASVHYDISPPTSRRILIRCRNGGDESEKPKENIVKFGQPRVQISGPMADMVRERLRKRNEL
jgi:hypothetical protein